MEKLILFSSDGHMTPPTEAWPEYLDKEYHHLLPELRADNERVLPVSAALPADHVLDIIDPSRSVWASGAYGVWDLDRRLAEMDRDGIAAEIVHFGDGRAISLFFGPTNRKRPPEVSQAGIRAAHRWAADTFGSASDRLFMIAESGPAVDMEVMLAETEWVSDHGFFGTMAPASITGFGAPPLYHEYYDPFWKLCEERGLLIVIHAGYGLELGVFMDLMIKLGEIMKGGDDLDVMEEAARPGVREQTAGLQNPSWGPRRALWQMMFGGVFDRHPDLKLFMTEVRADWVPATLQHLDATYRAAFKAGRVGAKRPPSEYWGTNVFAGISFIHEAEVAMRDEIGVETITIGRDYPHPESMWPNTKDWLKHAFAGVPEHETCLMLGENAVRILGLDRARLAEIADRIGPTFADLAGRKEDVDPRLIEVFAARSGYLKPREEFDPTIDEPIQEDLAGIGAGRI